MSTHSVAATSTPSKITITIYSIQMVIFCSPITISMAPPPSSSAAITAAPSALRYHRQPHRHFHRCQCYRRSPINRSNINSTTAPIAMIVSNKIMRPAAILCYCSRISESIFIIIMVVTVLAAALVRTAAMVILDLSRKQIAQLQIQRVQIIQVSVAGVYVCVGGCFSGANNTSS